MSPVIIFGVGVLVFLITVYGTVMAGGLLLTGQQLDQQPELDPHAAHPDTAPADRPLIPEDY